MRAITRRGGPRRAASSSGLTFMGRDGHHARGQIFAGGLPPPTKMPGSWPHQPGPSVDACPRSPAFGGRCRPAAGRSRHHGMAAGSSVK